MVKNLSQSEDEISGNQSHTLLCEVFQGDFTMLKVKKSIQEEERAWCYGYCLSRIEKKERAQWKVKGDIYKSIGRGRYLYLIDVYRCDICIEIELA